MSPLAMFGGTPTVPRNGRHVDWPVVTDADKLAMLRPLETGALVSNAEGEPEVAGLEAEFGAEFGHDYVVGVANGTVAITLALQALSIGAGDEVIVPALTFMGSALGVVHAGARPVFVDVDPVTFNLDPAHFEKAITTRTKAVLPVHLHGLPADMEEILAAASRHGLAVIEDAAQAHGAHYKGRPVGSLGSIAAFSLNATKNVPSCGEGGLVTTRSAELADRVRTRRQFGERIDERDGRSYESHVLGLNAKLSPVLAAFTRSQLSRFSGYENERQANVDRLLGRLRALPGLRVPERLPDRSHAFHILRFVLDAEAAGVEASVAAFRQAVHRALRAEGVPLSRYQIAPLPEQEAFADLRSETSPTPDDWPAARRVIDSSLTLQKRHLNPAAGPILDRYADAFEKAWESLDDLATVARGYEQRARSMRKVAA